jgi:hypothetical protein
MKMKTIIFSYAGPISGLQKALYEYTEQLEQLYEYDLQGMGVCDFSGYCSSQCRYYGSGCETF